MRFVFIVQGEGRGHITQAISLYKMLVQNNHEVVKVFVGSENTLNIPTFLEESIRCPIVSFKSPILKYDIKNCKLSISETIKNTVFNIPQYLKSLRIIQKKIELVNADVIINFYDVLGGLYNGFYNKSKTHFICIAHQYLLLDKTFPHPKRHFFDKLLVNFNSQITSINANKLLALSFNHREIINKKIYVVPPLLRSNILQITPNKQSFLLVYLSQSVLAKHIIQWHQKNPDTEIHCFWDKEQDYEVEKYSNNLFFHRLNSNKFIEMMASCMGLVSTAGFESICEAMYFQKPVLMTPIPNHYEQLCNAIDGEKAGAGIKSMSFEIDKLLDLIPNYFVSDFSKWQHQAEHLFLSHLTGELINKGTQTHFLAKYRGKSIKFSFSDIQNAFNSLLLK